MISYTWKKREIHNGEYIYMIFADDTWFGEVRTKSAADLLIRAMNFYQLKVNDS